jgi:hypothetical protein
VNNLDFYERVPIIYDKFPDVLPLQYNENPKEG